MSEHTTGDHLGRNAIGGVVGNVLEWYDFAVFGYFAPLIGELFFPSTSRVASLLSAFGVFACAYFARPFGGMIFGFIGDRMGRKTALRMSVLLMVIPTVLIGLLPTYAQAGKAAALLLVLLRLLQGLSVGGELISSISFMTEIAPPNRRGLFGSFTQCSATFGIMLGSLVALWIQGALDPVALRTWGWRVPFLAGLALGLVGLWMRQGLDETPAFERLKRAGEIVDNPVLEVVRAMPGRIVHVAVLVMLSGGGFYIVFVWWPTLLGQLSDPPIHHALRANTISMVVLMALLPVTGWLSDKVGRAPLLAASAIAMAVAVHPLFLLATQGTFGAALCAQLILVVLMSGFMGPMPAVLYEMFPARGRFSGIAIGYNLSMSLFGGTAPLVCTWLLASTGNISAPAGYMSLMALFSLFATFGLGLIRHRGVRKVI